MEFQSVYDSFIRFHLRGRSEQSAERIKHGLKHAEKSFLENVWWPAFQNLDGLHPEYEIYDFKDGYRYIDFAYIRPHFRIAIEIDGIGPHWKNITQWQLSDHYQRQNHLVIDRWHVLRFTYIDISEHPRLCQQTIQQLIGRLTNDLSGAIQTLRVMDREIIRLTLGTNRPITARDVVTHFHLSSNAATQHLKTLMDTDWLEPASGTQRIRSYRIHRSRANVQL